MISNSLTSRLCAGALSICAAGAFAAPITYADRTSYLAATSGNTTLDFEAQNNSAYQYHGASLTVDGVSFKQPDARLFVISEQYYSTSGHTGDYLHVNGAQGGRLQLLFDKPIYGFATDLSDTSFESIASFALDTGTTIDAVARRTSGAVPMGFFGFTSDVGISSIWISLNTRGSLALDNVAYSHAQAPGQTVPEPSSMALAAAALAGVGLVRRRKRG